MGNLDSIDLGYPPDSKYAMDAKQASLLDKFYKMLHDDIAVPLQRMPDDVKTNVDKAIHLIEAGLAGAGLLGGLGTLGVSLAAAHQLKEYLNHHKAQIVEKLQKAIDIAMELFRGILAPFNFPLVANRWGEELRKAAVDTSNAISEVGKPGNHGWKGDAAGLYEEESDKQKEAAKAVGVLCEKMEKHLRDWSDKCWDLYQEFIDKIAEVLGKLVPIVVKLSNPATAALAADSALDLAGDVATDFIQLSTKIVGFVHEWENAAGELNSERAAQDGLPNKNWPQVYAN